MENEKTEQLQSETKAKDFIHSCWEMIYSAKKSFETAESRAARKSGVILFYYKNREGKVVEHKSRFDEWL